MTKRQVSLLLGLLSQGGCAVYDDALRRESSDAAVDVARPGSVDGRDAASGLSRADAMNDGEVDRDAGPEASVAEDVVTRVDGDASDANDDADAAADVVPPPADALIPDADVDGSADGDAGTDAPSDNRDAPSDAVSDPAPPVCTVDFTVSGVTWETGGAAGSDAGSRAVRLVGDAAAIGAWSPDAGRAMVEKAPGAWSVGVVLADKVPVEFKFVKIEAGRVEWEEWLPFDSNRSLLVDCNADGGTVWVDAATEAGPASRAVGRSYGGAFGVRPLDATK